jgi:hypothetical protein
MFTTEIFELLGGFMRCGIIRNVIKLSKRVLVSNYRNSDIKFCIPAFAGMTGCRFFCASRCDLYPCHSRKCVYLTHNQNLMNLNNPINHGLDNGTAGTGSELVS